jgi:hypothetical protein
MCGPNFYSETQSIFFLVLRDEMLFVQGKRESSAILRSYTRELGISYLLTLNITFHIPNKTSIYYFWAKIITIFQLRMAIRLFFIINLFLTQMRDREENTL